MPSGDTLRRLLYMLDNMSVIVSVYGASFPDSSFSYDFLQLYAIGWLRGDVEITHITTPVREATDVYVLAKFLDPEILPSPDNCYRFSKTSGEEMHISYRDGLMTVNCAYM
ncbi:hypothetical protein OESDEN_17919 [Oesophagostomum dentatum]|uniref:Uncharacterized protein n=1 Tax=Oesophagostomum dentatum TaxID=61180 RepID=A0A0B1SFR0_OESDE|nr:hypothetical protein OESDEN_17919 [Oesophagostomum dentatum]